MTLVWFCSACGLGFGLHTHGWSVWLFGHRSQLRSFFFSASLIALGFLLINTEAAVPCSKLQSSVTVSRLLFSVITLEPAAAMNIGEEIVELETRRKSVVSGQSFGSACLAVMPWFTPPAASSSDSCGRLDLPLMVHHLTWRSCWSIVLVAVAQID